MYTSVRVGQLLARKLYSSKIPWAIIQEWSRHPYSIPKIHYQKSFLTADSALHITNINLSSNVCKTANNFKVSKMAELAYLASSARSELSDKVLFEIQYFCYTVCQWTGLNIWKRSKIRPPRNANALKDRMYLSQFNLGWANRHLFSLVIEESTKDSKSTTKPRSSKYKARPQSMKLLASFANLTFASEVSSSRKSSLDSIWHQLQILTSWAKSAHATVQRSHWAEFWFLSLSNLSECRSKVSHQKLCALDI